MTQHPLAPTTHTVMLAQVAEINARLADRSPSSSVRFRDLGIPADEGASRPSARAVLNHLSSSGNPEWPFITAHFVTDTGGHGSVAVLLHTASLRRLSHLLGLRQVWGI